MSKKTINTTTLSNELHGASLFFQHPAPKEQKDDQNALAQIHEQVSNTMSTPLLTDNHVSSRVPLSRLLSAEEIESMTFALRKERKTKVNTEIADSWKADLDAIAFELKVGKYELIEFIIGSFLGKLPRESGQ